MIYRPKGPAGEYARLAVHGPYRGCIHGCVYCYRKALAQRLGGKAPWDDARPQPRARFLEDLTAEAPRIAAGPLRDCPILFSFSTDPCQPLEAVHHLTERAAGLLTAQGLRMAVLTKAGPETARPVIEALAADPQGAERHWFGTTLTGVARSWEPQAATTAERAEALLLARDRGLRTWISFEPVLIPAASLNLIRAAAREGIDHLAIGRWNHDPRAAGLDWVGFRRQVVETLVADGYRESPVNLPDGRGRTYYLKEALRKAA